MITSIHPHRTHIPMFHTFQQLNTNICTLNTLHIPTYPPTIQVTIRQDRPLSTLDVQLDVTLDATLNPTIKSTKLETTNDTRKERIKNIHNVTMIQMITSIRTMPIKHIVVMNHMNRIFHM